MIAGKRFFKLLTVILCTAALCLCAVPAMAAGAVDTGKTCSLTLHYEKDTTVLPGMQVKIYRAADISADASFTLSGDFKNYSIAITNHASSEWKNAAEALSGYVIADKLAATSTGTTDAAGNVSFSGLSTGLYLIMTDSITLNNVVYKAEPALISLPNLDDNGNYVYDVSAAPKISTEKPDDSQTDLTVVKKWEDAGYENKRPASVTIELYKDGKLFDTQILSSDNNWTYTWKVPRDGSTWKIVEKNVDSNYKVTMTTGGSTFTVINTYDKPGNPNLPQTGQLWWPVIALAGGGLVIFTAGWLATKKKSGKEK